ncbi:deoxynucleoside kinase [Salinisphaera sp. Q1T1-3]|nr:deoxynucleoside kinase [Salinisphaera sp. Q1T1-3]
MKPGAYIAIEGPIGVGKTTLATRLAADLGAGLLAEQPDDNPFLADFYDHPEAQALSTQLFFLLQRARQIDTLRQSDLFSAGCVADFMFDKDPLFARLTLSGAELALYKDIHARLAWQAPCPDCVVYLDAGIDTLVERVARRGRTAEAGLTRAYLAQVKAAYETHFIDYAAAPVVRVDTDALDLLGDEGAYTRLREAIACPGTVHALPGTGTPML